MTRSGIHFERLILAENQAKLDSYEKSIKAAQERRRKVIIESKLYTYDKLSKLFGGAEGQVLLDAVTVEHTLIGKLTAGGMTYEQIGELADDSSADADNKSNDVVADGQTSFFDEKSNPYEV